jgi:hypothetical protein
MPPLPPIDGVVRFRFIGTLGGIPAGWRWFFGVGTGYPYTDAQLSAAATELQRQVVSLVLPQLTSAYTLQEVLAEDLSTGSAGIGISSDPPAQGGDTNAPIGADTAFLINLKVPLRYRGGHPRTYLPPPSQGSLLNPQLWKPNYVDPTTGIGHAVATAVSNAIADGTFTTLGLATLGSVSYRHAGAPRPVPVYTEVVATIASQRIASQRRRVGR